MTRLASVGGRSRRYHWYVLLLLVLCYLFNQIDRNILSIVAEEVKRDLGLSDARIGFLYGTAFAVCYAVFGVPCGRLADAWVRKNLIAVGLLVWSLATALTGTAASFGALAGYRVAVGIGEASLSPAAYSMIFDVFPRRLRATALALYQTGGFLGAGLAFGLGGLIVDGWRGLYPEVAAAPFALAPWQVAFFAVGLPGLGMAAWIWTLREPRRAVGADEERTALDTGTAPPAPTVYPLRLAWRELSVVVPPLTLWALRDAGAAAMTVNLGVAALLAIAAWGASAAFGEAAQWITVAVGLYASLSWGQSLRARDRSAFDAILGSRVFWLCGLGFGSQAFVTYGLAFWSAPFLMRAHGVSPGRAGALVGLGAMVGGWLGATLGGVVSDRLKARRSSGRVDIGLAAAVLTVPIYYGMLHATTLGVAWGCFLLTVATTSLWLGPGAATANELVPARVRSTASALYMLLVTFVGFAFGPFAVGGVSDALAAAGRSPGDALGAAMFLSTVVLAFSVALLWLARSRVGPAEERLQAHELAAPLEV